MFNWILIHGFIPNRLYVSTLISPIALSSLLGKIMDACIINKQFNVFKFHDLLFAYKANHSTVQCVSTIKKIISYYNLNKSPVYMCMLDVSKAFDKVNLVLLFNKLRLKGMCPLLLRFIINMYISQNIRVKWNDCISHEYAVSNGVNKAVLFHRYYLIFIYKI